MSRPTMDQVWAECAAAHAKRSVCMRRVQVGCVITNWDRTNAVAVGYNGPARSLAHDCRREVKHAEPAPGVYSPEQLVSPAPGSCTCVHAEANALIKAPYDRGPLRLYTTLSPCANCARLILNSAVRDVIYSQEYRNDEGLKILAQGGVFFRHSLDPYEDFIVAGSVVHRFNDGSESIIMTPHPRPQEDS